VDEELAPLILALWKRGIDTCLSCQENRPGVAWIMFPTAEDAKKFLNAVAVYPEDEDRGQNLYDRIVGVADGGNWDYSVSVDDWAVKYDEVDGHLEEACTGPADFEFGLSIRFPTTDIPLLLKQLAEASASAGLTAGYCDLCREKERELYGEVLSSPDARHERACTEAGCGHPVFYTRQEMQMLMRKGMI
jgi:hypothetical protein